MKYAACVLIAAALLAATAADARVRNVTDPDAPRSLPAEGPVSVQWTDPAEFTDLKFSGNCWEARQGNWVYQLAEHLRKSAAKQLPQGDRLEVTIQDFDRAGHYEPWRGAQMQDVRIVRDIYPPSMKLEFRHYGADGQLLAEGTREIRDMGFLVRGPQLRGSDNLQYEKRMIDDWVRDELRKSAVASN
ncbi:MAG TPA: DUF3016 domain-containing protein [Luteimonas sp.]|nr:DUF3016 domain-containing protein [Luteimonas sp.]